MTLEEAIKQLEEPHWLITEGHTLEYYEAVQLGIEALKDKLEARRNNIMSSGILLPGETDD